MLLRSTVLFKAGASVTLTLCLFASIGAAHAQDSEGPNAPKPQSAADVKPLIALPSTPTPSPAAKIGSSPTASLTGSSTVNSSSTVEKSAALHEKPAARTADVDNADALSDALGGVVTTDTVTLAGHDFYTVFAQAWNAIPLSDRYIIAVHERPSARYGSLVWVEFRQHRVFQAFLPIARPNVKALAENAASVAFQNVMQADLTRLLFHEADMASDEL
jgi:curli production assembly/transport component CsgE